MKASLRTKASLLSAVAGVCMCAAARADITSFTPGDLVVLRAGTGASALPASGAVPAFLDQYTTSGAAAGTVTLPSVNSAGVNAVMVDVASVANHEGILTLSGNGNYLTFTGYNTSSGSASNGVVGEISQSASTINTATSLVGQGQDRAATTVDGNEFWTTSAAGVQYIAVGGSPTNTLNASWNGRSILVVNNSNLVAGSGSNSFNASNGHGVQQIGTGLPTGSLPATSDMQLLNNPSDTMDGTGIYFANLPGGNGSYDGYDVLYTVGGASGSQAISKYAFNTSNNLFNLVGSAVTPASYINTSGGTVLGNNATLLGLTVGQDSQGNEDLYYTDGAGLYELTDSSQSAFGNLPSSAPTVPLVANGTNEEILGVAFAPTAAVPEPTTLGVLSAAAIGLLVRRRRTV